MKEYRILKTFKGSQTGIDTSVFEAGTVAGLSDYLAAVVVPEGWAEEAAEKPEGIPLYSVEGKVEKVEEVFLDEQPSAEVRETKVVAPEETKPAKPKKGKK